MYWFVSFVTGTLFLAFAEVIYLLQEQVDIEYHLAKVTENINSFSKDSISNKTSADKEKTNLTKNYRTKTSDKSFDLEKWQNDNM